MPETKAPRAGADAGHTQSNQGKSTPPTLSCPEAKINPQLFDGATFDPAKDGPRLAGQLAAVRGFMWDGRWRTLSAIAHAVRCSEASASARLRDLRKPKFGGYTIDRRRISDGLFAYRLVPERDCLGFEPEPAAV